MKDIDLEECNKELDEILFYNNKAVFSSKFIEKIKNIIVDFPFMISIFGLQDHIQIECINDEDNYLYIDFYKNKTICYTIIDGEIDIKREIQQQKEYLLSYIVIDFYYYNYESLLQVDEITKYLE